MSDQRPTLKYSDVLIFMNTGSYLIGRSTKAEILSKATTEPRYEAILESYNASLLHPCLSEVLV